MTSIEWTNETWNPTRGCTRISPGCGGKRGEGGCYAERMAIRLSGPGRPYHGLVRSGPQGPRWTGKVVLDRHTLAVPLSWDKPRRVFVDSMSDLFHEALSNDEIAAVFGVMMGCPSHTFQVLTKRSERMRHWFDWIAEQSSTPAAYCERAALRRLCPGGLTQAELWILRKGSPDRLAQWPLPNVWLGVSVETDDYVSRILNLEQVPAAVRFASLEPLLAEPRAILQHIGRLGWVIAGGESGPGARPCELRWLEAIAAQCAADRVPVFVKQAGANALGEGLIGEGLVRLRLKHRKGGDPAEWPLHLRLRQYPDRRPSP